MKSEASVRQKLAAARQLREEMKGMIVDIYLEGVINILAWILSDTPDDPEFKLHDITLPPGSRLQ